MTTMTRVVVVALCVAAVSCGRVRTPPRGGDAEKSLLAETAAVDIPRVRQLIAAGADPNKMVTFEGASHSAWQYALQQMREKTPDTMELVKVLLKSGADPNTVWGGAVIRGIAKEGEWVPIDLAMVHPYIDVVRAMLHACMRPSTAENALVGAVEREQIEFVHLFVERGVDVNCHPGANTPLTAAIEARNFALMTYLEDHGARERP